MDNKTRINKYTIALATSIAMITSSSATTIAWGEFDLDATASEISTNGTLIEALNLVNTDAREATNTTTINGVVFTATYLFNSGYSEDDPFGVSTGDASLDLLYLQAGYDYNDAQLLTLTGLTIGAEYELQSFFGDNRGTPSKMNVGDGFTVQARSSGTIENGAWIIGTFTADATIQIFHSAEDNSTTSLLSGYQLRYIYHQYQSSNHLPQSSLVLEV